MNNLRIDSIISGSLDHLWGLRTDPLVIEATRLVKARVLRKEKYLGLLADAIDINNRFAIQAIKVVFTRSPNLLLLVLDQAEAAARAIRPGDQRHDAARRYVYALREAALCLSKLHDEMGEQAELLDKIDQGR